ncbi:MAG: hypothetical protein ABI378_13490 [Chitinophagaceae bacterium]
MMLTLLVEPTAYFASQRWHNNMPIYNIFSPIELFLVSLYFNYAVTYLRRRNLGIIIGGAGIVLSILNTIFLQPIDTINSNFLLFESTTIIIYCLLALHQILLDEEHLPYRYAHFWITLCFLLFWSATFTGWGFYALLLPTDKSIISLFDKILTTANFIFYLGIGTVLMLLLKHKLIPTSCA